MKFEETVVKKTVDRLIKGEDYRNEVVNSINMAFFEYAILFSF